MVCLLFSGHTYSPADNYPFPEWALKKGFTIIELMVVIAIIAVLAALILPALSGARAKSKQVTCLNNLKQISLALQLYANDDGECYPRAAGTVPWDTKDADDDTYGWMQQLLPYASNRKIYKCPSDGRADYSYFLSTRAAYVAAGSRRAAVQRERIAFPEVFVLAGDTIWYNQNDCDKDDYTQNCVGGPANGTPYEEWRAHNGGQNILFADGHCAWYQGYVPSEMTFRYDTMHGWAEP